MTYYNDMNNSNMKPLGLCKHFNILTSSEQHQIVASFIELAKNQFIVTKHTCMATMGIYLCTLWKLNQHTDDNQEAHLHLANNHNSKQSVKSECYLAPTIHYQMLQQMTDHVNKLKTVAIYCKRCFKLWSCHTYAYTLM